MVSEAVVDGLSARDPPIGHWASYQILPLVVDPIASSCSPVVEPCDVATHCGVAGREFSPIEFSMSIVLVECY